MYDVARRNSFENLDLWLAEAKKHAPRDVQVIVIGNTELLKDHPEWIRKRRGEAAEAEEWAGGTWIIVYFLRVYSECEF